MIPAPPCALKPTHQTLIQSLAEMLAALSCVWISAQPRSGVGGHNNPDIGVLRWRPTNSDQASRDILLSGRVAV